MTKKTENWFVYVLRCNDQSLYTGITNDIERRLKEHNDSSKSSKSAKYTRARQPVKLVYFETTTNRSTASKREYALKKLNREQKQQLISDFTFDPL